MSLVLTALLVLTSVSGLDGSPTNHYTCSEHGFSIDFPQGWWIERGTLSNIIAKALWRDGTDTATILVSVNRDGVGIASVDPEEFARSAAARTPSTLNGYGRDAEADGVPLWVDVTMTIQHPRRALYYAIPHNGKVVLVTCTSHPRNFARHSSEFYRTARSVSFEDADGPVAAKPAEPVVFQDSALGLSLKLPGGWSSQPARAGSGQGEVLNCIGPTSDGQRFRPVLQIDYMEGEGDLTAADFVALPDSDLGGGRWRALGIEVVSKALQDLAGHESARIEYLLVMEAPGSAPLRLRAVEYWMPLDGGVLVAKTVADEQNEEDLDSVLAALQQMTLSPKHAEVQPPESKRRIPWEALAVVGAIFLGAIAVLVRRRIVHRDGDVGP